MTIMSELECKDMDIIDNGINKITFLTGDSEVLLGMPGQPAWEPFTEEVCDFLNDLSGKLMKMPDSRAYSDIMTFAFWIRKAAVMQLADRFADDSGDVRMGRGLAFHIAPSNVPVNFAFSLVSGMLTGNTNVVRIPGKNFPQVSMIIEAINDVIEQHSEIKPRIALVRYGRDREVNDLLSSMSDIRMIWGGDATIAELRKSLLPPRSIEITFADRYSLAVINSDRFLELNNTDSFIRDFYNDTYFSDQNACTSPRIIIWTGNNREAAKDRFWSLLHDHVAVRYGYQDIQGVDKLTDAYLALNALEGSVLEPSQDNLVVRVRLAELNDDVMNYQGNSGFFLEYDCDDLMELKPICDNKKCQTIGVLEDVEAFQSLIRSGIKGVDRIVPIGKTMDFDLLWDGYDLVSMLTRRIAI